MATVTPISVWMGWTPYESRYPYYTLDSLKMQGDYNMTKPYGGDLAYGTYMYTATLNIDALYNLLILGREEFPTVFHVFDRYTQGGYRQMYDNIYNDRQGFYNLWCDVCEREQEAMQYIQDICFVRDYWEELLIQFPALRNRTIDEYDKGSLASMAIRTGPQRGDGTNLISSAVNAYLSNGIYGAYQTFEQYYAPRGDDRWMRQYQTMQTHRASGSYVYTVPGSGKPDILKKRRRKWWLYLKRRNR